MPSTTNLEDAAVLAARLRTYAQVADLQTVTLTKEDIIVLLNTIDKNIAVTFKDLTYEEKQSVNSLVTAELIKNKIITQAKPFQPDVTPASNRCPEPYHWSCFDGVATEVEVLEFLHALVRMLKPKFALETGTYLGYGSVYMALAMQQNGFGDLLSCDPDAEALSKAITLAMVNEVDKIVRFVPMTGKDVIKQLDDRSLDLVFIDSGDVITRIEEISLILCKLSYPSVVVVHDTGNYQMLLEHLYSLDFNNKIKMMSFGNTPRGLAIFNKIW